MLILSRRHEETVLLPDLDIEIRVLKIRGGSVAVGITAPRHVRILRGELCDKASASSTESMKPQLAAAGLPN